VESYIEPAGLGRELGNKYSPVCEQWARDCHGALLLYSVTSHASFDHTTDYLELLRKYRGVHITEKSLPIALVGNKCDLGDGPERQVERGEGEKLARTLELMCGFREISAKTGEGVEELLYDIVRKLQEPQVERGEEKKLYL
jgi:GTPase SAR1 family protein